MAGPIILSNISVPLLGAVDTAVVGHLPAPYYIGAVGIGAMRADVMMVAMLLSFAVYMAAMFLMLPVLDNHGLWLALTTFLSLRGGARCWRSIRAFAEPSRLSQNRDPQTSYFETPLRGFLSMRFAI